MYSGYLFVIAFAILVTNTICDDSKISILSDGKTTSMSTHELCTKAGFVKNTAKTVHIKSESKPAAAASTKMSTGDIILTVLGVTAGVLILAFVGNYYYNKQKVN